MSSDDEGGRATLHGRNRARKRLFDTGSPPQTSRLISSSMQERNFPTHEISLAVRNEEKEDAAMDITVATATRSTKRISKKREDQPELWLSKGRIDNEFRTQSFGALWHGSLTSFLTDGDRTKEALSAVVVSPESSSSSSSLNMTSTILPGETQDRRNLSGNLVRPRWWNDVVPPQPQTVHTLILGSHPSAVSLQRQQYYANPMNAFWWIAGDCLGFRRDKGQSPATGKPYKFALDLRFDEDRILSYSDQLKVLTWQGFALWDIVQSCSKKGATGKSSLDSDIQQAVPNPIREFCQEHKHVRRIVLANGGSSAQLFIRHFPDWLASGELDVHVPQDKGDAIAASQTLLKAILSAQQRYLCKKSSMKKHKRKRIKSNRLDECTAIGATNDVDTDDQVLSPSVRRDPNARVVTLILAISVSPAAARYSYVEKRAFWEKYVYAPASAVTDAI